MEANLDYAILDDVALALSKGRYNVFNDIRFHVGDVSPIVEYNKLVRDYSAPSLSSLIGHVPLSEKKLVQAVEEDRREWFSDNEQNIGLYKFGKEEKDDATEFIEFCYWGQRKAEDVGFSQSVSRKLVAAMKELHSNVVEHAEVYDDAVVVWKADGFGFEFCISDDGIGVLDSLRQSDAFCDEYDHGHALELAIKEGVSRYGVGVGNGYGFRPIFVGLANLRCSLRFRSGDHSLEIKGYPETIKARVRQKVPVNGFVASVRCFLS